MSWSGLDFYNRLSDLCAKNGTTVTAFLKDAGRSQSAGTYMKKKATPDSNLVALAAAQFGVATEWLLGLTDNPLQLSRGKQYVLDAEEASLIDSLRAAPLLTKETVLKMAAAALAPDPAPLSPPVPLVFSSPKGGIVNHSAQKPRPRPTKRVEGSAAAGLPITAVPDDDLRISVPAKYLSDRYFIVRAQGDSMVDAGIDSGDYCVFDSQAYPDEGSIVLAQVDGMTDQPDLTIKRLFPRGDRIELRPANRAYPPMFFPAEDVRVTGVFVAALTGEP